MRKLHQNMLFTVVVIALMTAGTAFAGTATANMAVSANVSADCQIAASSLGFGVYDPVSANGPGGTDAATTANLSVICSSGSTANITLDQGLNAAGGSTDGLPLRQMADGGSDRLAYTIYQDGGHTTIWGNTSETGVNYEGTGSVTNVTVFGVAPKGQSIPSGTYNDLVVATITF
jgi:spore coat protein U-like protein